MEIDEKKFRRLFFVVFLRTFFLQSVWNFKGMQNLGFLFVIKPVLDFLYKGDERTRAYLRHMDFFNTHPFCASYIIGIVIKAEKNYATTGDEKFLQEISGAKKVLGGPVAAFGDSIIWGFLRPFVALLASFFVFYFSKDVSKMFIGPLIAFFGFNFFHLQLRWKGLKQGFEYGIEAIDRIFTGKLHFQIGLLRTTSIVLIVLLLIKGFMALEVSMFLKIIYPVVFVGIVFFLRNVSPVLLFYGIFLLGILCAGLS